VSADETPEAKLQRLTEKAVEELRAAGFDAAADSIDDDYDNAPEDLETLSDAIASRAYMLSPELRAELWPPAEEAEDEGDDEDCDADHDTENEETPPGPAARPAASILPVAPAPAVIRETPARVAVALPVKRVRPSLYQPRTGLIDVSDIQPSIAEHGLFHPIWVRTVRYERPDPTTGEATYYEIVHGERRWIATSNLGRETIDAEIHDELSDLDVYLIQADENEKRKALTPLEQADVVGRLHREGERGFGLPVNEIALRLGIEPRTAYRRLLLSQLGTAGRALLTEGKLLLGAALAIAALPYRDQDDAAELVAPSSTGIGATGKPRQLADVERLLDGRFHLRVYGELVPFDPARRDLAGAPPCAECPKRLDGKAQGDLFEREADCSLEEDARCPDRTCHKAKADQTWEEQVGEACTKHLKILDAAEARKLFAGSTFIGGPAQLRDLGAEVPATETFGVISYGQLLGDAAPPVALVRDPHGKARWLADWATTEAALAAKLAEKKGKPAPTPKASYTPTTTAPSLPEGKATVTKPATPAGPDPATLEREGEEIAGLEALGAIVAKAERRQVNVGFWRFLVALFTRLAAKYFKVGLSAVVERRLLRKDDAVMARAAKKHAAAKGAGKVPDSLVLLAEVEELKEEEAARALFVELVASAEGFHHFGDEEDSVLLLACRFYGLDLGELKDTAIAGLKRKKTKDAKKAEEKATTKPEPAPAATAAAPAPKAPKKPAEKHEGPITPEIVAEHFLTLLEVGNGWMLEALEAEAIKHFAIPEDGEEVFVAVVDAAEKIIIAPGGGARVNKDALLELVAPPRDDKPKRKIVGPLAVGILRSRIKDALTRHMERAGKNAGLTLEDLTAAIERDLGEIPDSGKKVLAAAFTSLLAKDLVEGDDGKLRFAPPKPLPSMPVTAKGE
jgi:ParB/RepB/Spo0J family partition protein